MIARLRPGAALGGASRRSTRTTPPRRRTVPRPRRWPTPASATLVVPLHADHVAAIRPTLLLVQAGALFLLLIGAVNLVNLLLIRASGRPEGAGRPAGHRREPAARGERGHGGDHCCSPSSAGCSGSPSGRAGSASWPRSAPIACRWAPTSPSTRAWRSSLSPARSSWGSRSACRSPGTTCEATRPRAAIRIPRRHRQPRRPAPAPRLPRRPDRAGLRAARGGGPARAQPPEGPGRFSRLPPENVLSGQISLPVEELPGRGGPPRLHRAVLERARPPARRAGGRA